jgi:hypothetical protein
MNSSMGREHSEGKRETGTGARPVQDRRSDPELEIRSPSSLIALQSLAGNRAVAGTLAPPMLQRQGTEEDDAATGDSGESADADSATEEAYSDEPSIEHPFKP